MLVGGLNFNAFWQVQKPIELVISCGWGRGEFNIQYLAGRQANKWIQGRGQTLCVKAAKPQLMFPSSSLLSGTATSFYHFSRKVKDRGNGSQCRLSSSFLIVTNTIGPLILSDWYMPRWYTRVKGRRWIVLLLCGKPRQNSWISVCRIIKCSTYSTFGCHPVLYDWLYNIIESKSLAPRKVKELRLIEVARNT